MVAINRIVFMGTPEFAVPSLKALIDKGENVVCVVTQPDRGKGRGRKVVPPPVKELALRAAIPVLQPEHIRGDDFHADLSNFEPDIIALTAYGKILPGSIINLPPLGTINVHGSLLPKYRGAAPIQWALINGETETGITIMQMDEGVDTGDILLQEKISIEPQDTAASLSVRLAELGGTALGKALDLLRQDRLQPVKQDEKQASLAPLLKKEDGLVDWSQSAKQISGLIRGLDPWPTTYTTLSGKRLRLFSPEIVAENPCQETFPEPGVVCRADRNGLLVTTGNGCLLIKEIQAEGSRRMGVAAYISGNPLKPGTLLGQ
ncbi:MAG: methionyl-tRNA formyltransferase [Desulfobacterales bacterium SG8_35]|nr:MAG: methionyl-tRNA formyltransferase [Desulfobacterales bacterium SG8_35]